MKTFLRYICRAMEMTCALKDRFGLDEWECRITGDYCYLARWADSIDQKFGLNTWPQENWKTLEGPVAFYQEYVDACN